MHFVAACWPADELGGALLFGPECRMLAPVQLHRRSTTSGVDHGVSGWTQYPADAILVECRRRGDSRQDPMGPLGSEATAGSESASMLDVLTGRDIKQVSPKRDERIVATYLAIVATLLLIVGIVSGTFLRHAVQIAPVVAACGLVLRSPVVGAFFAIGVSAFWMGIMTLIWLYLLGWADVATGNYTHTEVILTFAIFAFAGGIFPNCVNIGQPLSMLRRVLTILLGIGLQFAVMVLSFQAPFTDR